MERDCYIITAQLQQVYWWYEGRRRIIAAMIEKAGLPKDAQILEAGCGTGANLKMLQRYGTVSGFDPEDLALENARKVEGCTIEKGFLPEPVPFSGPFDLVGAFDVIEHVEDDLGSLSALARLTKPGGCAIFTVPAFQFLWSKHDEMNHHKRRYTRGQFADLLRKAGYEVSFISYCNMWLFPVAVAVRYLKKLIGKSDESDVKMGSETVNKILCEVFSSERHLLRHTSLPFGLSIIAVCRKPGGV